MEFYKILIDIMNEKNLSIPDVARLTGLSDSTIRSIISRKTKNVSLEVAFKMSKGLNVSLERLNGELIEAPNTLSTNEISATTEKTATEILEAMSTTIAAHDDDLTYKEKSEMDRRILDKIIKRKK